MTVIYIYKRIVSLSDFLSDRSKKIEPISERKKEDK